MRRGERPLPPPGWWQELDWARAHLGEVSGRVADEAIHGHVSADARLAYAAALALYVQLVSRRRKGELEDPQDVAMKRLCLAGARGHMGLTARLRAAD